MSSEDTTVGVEGSARSASANLPSSSSKRRQEDSDSIEDDSDGVKATRPTYGSEIIDGHRDNTEFVDAIKIALESADGKTKTPDTVDALVDDMSKLTMKVDIEQVGIIQVCGKNGMVLGIHGEYVLVKCKSGNVAVKRMFLNPRGAIEIVLVHKEMIGADKRPVKVRNDAIPFISFFVDDITKTTFVMFATRNVIDAKSGACTVWNLKDTSAPVAHKVFKTGGMKEICVVGLLDEYGAVPEGWFGKKAPTSKTAFLVVPRTAVLTSSWIIVVVQPIEHEQHVAYKGGGVIENGVTDSSVIMAYKWRNESGVCTPILPDVVEFPDTSIVRFQTKITGITHSVVDKEAKTLVWFATDRGLASLSVAANPEFWAVLPAAELHSQFNRGEPDDFQLSEADVTLCTTFARDIVQHVVASCTGEDEKNIRELIRQVWQLRVLNVPKLKQSHMFVSTGQHSELVSVSRDVKTNDGYINYIDRDLKKIYRWQLSSVIDVLCLAKGKGAALFACDLSVAIIEKPSETGAPPAHAGTYLTKEKSPYKDERTWVTNAPPSNHKIVEFQTLDETTSILVAHSYEHVLYCLKSVIQPPSVL